MIGLETLAAKLFGTAVLASVLVFGGCRWQHRLDEGSIAKAEARVETLHAELKRAAAALGDAARRFREIDAATAAAGKEAAQRAARAESAAASARKDKERLADDLAELQRQAARDAETCAVERMRICGSSLR